MECSWKNTRTALGDLENLLLCGVCRQLVQDPQSLGSCEHFFCSTCIKSSIGKTCPECGLPSHVKDVCTNRQLQSAVGLCQKLSFLLLRDSLNLPGTPTPSQKVAKERTPRRNAHKKCPDFQVEVQVSATIKQTDPTPNRKRSTRISSKVNETEGSPVPVVKKAKVTKQRQQVQQSVSPAQVKIKRVRSRTRTSSKSDTATEKPESATELAVPAQQSVRTPMQERSKKTTVYVKTPIRIQNEKTPLKAKNDRTLKTPVRTPSSSGSRSQRGSKLGSPLASPVGTPAHLKRNAKGETPLHVAVIKGDYDRVRTLLDDGAEVNTKDHAGWTPLHEACNHGYVALVELLLEAGAYVNVPGGDNETPLHDAVLNNRVEVARLLIAHGADKLAKNLSGNVPHDLAKTDEMREVLDSTDADSQLDTSATSVPSTLAEGPVVLLATGLNREERACVQKCATLLHGKMVTDFCNEVTHLVTSVNREGQCPRTLKFLQTVLMGKWIINKEWVNMCLEYELRVSEEPFEVPGCSTNPDQLTPERARHNTMQQLPGLFDGCHFFLQGAFTYPTPSKHDLTELIHQGGGKLVTRLPKPETMDEYAITVPYHAKPGSTLSHCSHYIITDSRDAQFNIIHPRLCRTTASWLMDCIAKFEMFEIVPNKA